MIKKGNLFKLIKSLSQTEKRYFRLFCTLQKEDSAYLKLFETLDSLSVYDKEKVRMLLKDEPFFSHIAVTKHHLQHLILKSLRNYHEKLSIDSEVNNLIFNAEILYNKELFELCHSHLEKAKKLALKIENFTALISIYEWQRRLSITRYGPNDPRFKEMIGHQAAVIEKIKTLNAYWDLVADVSNVSYTSDDDMIHDHPLIMERKTDSLMSEILHNQVLYNHSMLKLRSAGAEKYINRIIEVLEAHPERIKDEPGIYSTSLGNKVSLLLFEKRWEEATALLEKIRQIPSHYGLKKNSKFSVRTICRSYNLELEACRDRKDITAGCSLIPEVQSYLEQNASAIPDDYYVLFWHQFSNLYFMNQEYSNALVWINRIMDSKLKPFRDLTAYTRILHLMVHFEMGNTIFLKYAIDSHRRYFKNMKLLNHFVKACLNFFNKMAGVSKSQLKTEFQGFYTQLFEKENGLANGMPDYIDIRSWLESKLAFDSGCQV